MNQATRIPQDTIHARIEAAKLTLQRFTTQKADLQSRLLRIKQEKVPLAADALSGNSAAKTKLANLNYEAQRILQLLEDVDLAVTSAEGDLASAVRAQEDQAERRRLEKLTKLSSEFREAGAQMDQSLMAFVAACERMNDVADKMRRIDERLPSVMTMRVNLKNAVQGALMSVNLTEATVDKSHRRRIADLIAGWVIAIEDRIGQRRAATQGKAA